MAILAGCRFLHTHVPFSISFSLTFSFSLSFSWGLHFIPFMKCYNNITSVLSIQLILFMLKMYILLISENFSCLISFEIFIATLFSVSFLECC